MRRSRLAVLGGLLAVPMGMAVTSSALAATTSSTLTVKATVEQVCTVDSSTPLEFTPYDSNLESASQTAIVLNCTTTGQVTIALEAGLNYTGASRAMAGATAVNDRLLYSLWKDASHTDAWGDGVTAGLGTTDSFFQNGGATSKIVYGTIPAGQIVTNDVYVDQVTVRVDF